MAARAGEAAAHVTDLAVATAPAPVGDVEFSRAATEQILRRLGLVIGTGAMIVMVLELPAVLVQPINQSVWPELHIVSAYLMFGALAIVSTRGPAAAIRRTAGAAAVCYLAATVATPLVY
jgi:hypothetical protein